MSHGRPPHPGDRTRPADATAHAAAAVTMLFVPGDRPDRFAKAAAAGADLVVIDLEDAVAPEHKDAARSWALAWAQTHACAIRLNAHGTPWFAADLEALRGTGTALMLPKAETTEAIDAVAAAAEAAAVIALIETPLGILNAAALASHPAVVRLAVGTFDLAVRLGVAPADTEALLPSRGALVLASAAAGLTGPIDGVTAALDDPALLIDDTAYARRLGFAGKLCVHPRQLAPVTAAFAPSEQEVTWAQGIVDALGPADMAVTAVDGAMVDKPVVDRARSILARAASRTS